MNNKELLASLNKAIGSYRAEWLQNRIFDLFEEPSYFPALKDTRPCILEGGRGTGKTTTLRGLSYQGQYSICNQNIQAFDNNINFIGIYYKAETNHVRAFEGPDLDEQIWSKIFSHYFNLIICYEILNFLKWHHNLNHEGESLDIATIIQISYILQIEGKSQNLHDLISNLESGMYEFQNRLNNIEDLKKTQLSHASTPINYLTDKIIKLKQFRDKQFFFLIDEFENFSDYQQKLMNTMIKHNTNEYTFKIGVREQGWRIKHTLNSNEILNEPGDYVLFNIVDRLTSDEKAFSTFVKNIFQHRINSITPNSDNIDIESSFTGLSIEQEALELDIYDNVLLKEIESVTPDLLKQINGISPLYKFFISYWAKLQNQSLSSTIQDFVKNRSSWDTRYENNKYEMLFKIRRGRGKGGIQKYYCGWNTYIKLANGNIRYLMELVYKAFEKHLLDEKDINDPISPKHQTLAAQDIGNKNLTELQGLTIYGSQLTKLLLSIGRVFQVLASSYSKHAPEQNQFSIKKVGNNDIRLTELFRAGVMHLALVSVPGNKLSNKSSTKETIYTLHPIFSPYFQYSHRKKRKIEIDDNTIIGLIDDTNKTINKLLKSLTGSTEDKENLPQQMELFGRFYD